MTDLHNGTATSIEAAIHARKFKGQQHTRIMDHLRTCADGATREEIELATGISGNAVRPRISELRRAGAIVETERTRKTTTGRSAVVLEVKI